MVPKRLQKPLFVSALLVALVLSGCSVRIGPEPEAPDRSRAPEYECGLVISRDFGSEVLKAEWVEVNPGESVLDLLKRNAEVTTLYGGGFVRSIDGLASKNAGLTSPAYDWFFGVNGSMASVGALETELDANDVVWWDYHGWATGGGAMTASTMAWPRPFCRNGSVLFTEATEAAAETMVHTLQAAGGAIEKSAYKADSLAELHAPTMLLLVVDDVHTDQWLQSLFENAWRAGLCGTVLDHRLVGFDGAGRHAVEYEDSACLVLALMHHAQPLWLLIAHDAATLERVTDTLSRMPERDGVPCAYAMLLTPERVIGLPVMGEDGR